MLNSGRSASLKSSRDKDDNIVIEIPSEMRLVKEVSSAILVYIASAKVEESKLFDIKLCVEEAVRNAIAHGNRNDRRRIVKVSYRIGGGSLVVEVEDQGKGFDHANLPDPTRDENLLKSGGRGVYLIRHLMDKVEYNQAGNKVRMIKNL